MPLHTGTHTPCQTPVLPCTAQGSTVPLQHLPASHCCCHNVTFEASSGLLRPPAPTASTKTRGTLLSPSSHRKGAATKARMGPGGASPAAPSRDLAGLLLQAASLQPQHPGCAGPWCGREHAGCAHGTPCPPAPCPQHHVPSTVPPMPCPPARTASGQRGAVALSRCSGCAACRGKKKNLLASASKACGLRGGFEKEPVGSQSLQCGLLLPNPAERQGQQLRVCLMAGAAASAAFTAQILQHLCWFTGARK